MMIDDGVVPFSINAADKDGWTALHLAANEGHTATAQALLAAGAG